jgi:hypothetical protein
MLITVSATPLSIQMAILNILTTGPSIDFPSGFSGHRSSPTPEGIPRGQFEASRGTPSLVPLAGWRRAGFQALRLTFIVADVPNMPERRAALCASPRWISVASNYS